MRKPHKRGILLLGLCIAVSTGSAVAQLPDGARSRPGWAESPYRSFGPAQRLSDAAVVLDEREDPELRQALSAEIVRLSIELFERQGWPVPFRSDDPLRIYVARGAAEGVRRLAARALSDGRLVRPAIQLDASDLSNERIVREAGRLFALAAISTYGVADSGFLTTAAAELLSARPGDDLEPARAVAAAPTVRVADHALTMGRAFLEEFVRETGGISSLRLVWQRASERGQAPLASLAELFEESTGRKIESLFLRSAARLYSNLETEPGPSQIGLFDLEAGGLDAGAPEPWTFRHRTFVPADGAGSLRVSWPADGAAGAAVVRYRDPALPPDVLFLEPGLAYALPISGVARVDWVVAGLGMPGAPAPAQFEPAAAQPFAGLSAQVAAAADGPRIAWTTSSHEGLAGWAIFRDEVQPDGRILRTGPQIVPAAKDSSETYRYVYLDPSAAPGIYYRYSVWAVTDEGLLAKAFSATLRTAD